MTGNSLSHVVAHAIGGGWGCDAPSDGLIPVRVVRGADFSNVAVSSLDGVPLRYEVEKKVATRTLLPDDIILEISGGTREQPTGRTVRMTKALLQQSVEAIIPASFCRPVRIDPLRVDPVFVYYALQYLYNEGDTWEYQNQSTGLSNFQFEMLKARYRLPSLELTQQNAIAEVLGALDDKIAVNDRLVATSEELAETSWSAAARRRNEAAVVAGKVC